MPYIEQSNRDRLDAPIAELQGLCFDEGELNYVITRIVSHYGQGSYSAINGAIGVLECVKLELYRRVAASYENHKAEINGDVYSLQLPPEAPWEG